ncbi:MAG: glycosyltransferase [Desulfobulbaceae bacterium]|nr:glycosyltransferase [Candidatus Kapabacteria bacterium]MBS4000208.1 glycosyltransferase [Desulfobulbaceae bacterium]
MLLYVVIIAIVVYFLRSAIMFAGSLKSKQIQNIKLSQEFTPFVSVIVPSRNEENNIETCIHSLMETDYPIDKFEIIAVNDRSTDKTGEILRRLLQLYSNLKIVEISEATSNPNLKGKPGALHRGILESKGEIVMMTDADCVVPKTWLKSISGYFSDVEVGLVAAFTMVKHNSEFEKIQAIEWIYMHTMASAGLALGKPLGCFGNNLSIRRSVYDEVGGYENIKFSVTEDLALIQAVHKSGYKVHYPCSSESSVTTLPCITFAEYISQHRRWAIGGLGLGWVAPVFVLSSVLIWAALIIGIFSVNLIWILAVLFVRLFGDFSLIMTSIGKLKHEHLQSRILSSILYFMLIELIIPPMLIDKKIVWKGQVFGK